MCIVTFELLYYPASSAVKTVGTLIDGESSCDLSTRLSAQRHATWGIKRLEVDTAAFELQQSAMLQLCLQDESMK